MMLVKIVLLLLAAAAVSGLPEPDPDTNINLSVDSQDAKMNSYLDVAKDAAGTSIKIVSNIFGKAMGYDCCVVDGVEYENGATDVPCGDQYNINTKGTCNHGNVQCVNKIFVTYTTQVFDNATHNIGVEVEPFKSFFDVMKIAEEVNSYFSFTYKMYNISGVMLPGIESIHDVHNADPYYWMFYQCKQWGAIECKLTSKGVASTFPKNDEHYLFRYQDWRNTTHV